MSDQVQKKWQVYEEYFILAIDLYCYFHNHILIDIQSPEAEELSMLSIQLASKFLFYTGFHTKKALRGTATDWHDILCHHLLGSKAVRSWFAHNVLFNHPHRY